MAQLIFLLFTSTLVRSVILPTYYGLGRYAYNCTSTLVESIALPMEYGPAELLVGQYLVHGLLPSQSTHSASTLILYPKDNGPAEQLVRYFSTYEPWPS